MKDNKDEWLQRLNPVISLLERGEVAFVSFAQPDPSNALVIAEGGYEGAVFEIEYNPYDIRTLRDCSLTMMNRKTIAQSGSIAPIVRIPPNGDEINQWIAKPVLDSGAMV